MKDKQEIQQKYMEFQMLEAQMKQTQKQMQLLEDQLIEVIYTQQSLEEISKVKIGTEILVPINNGIFTKATIAATDELIVNVGANTAVKKTVQATKEMLGQQLGEVESMQDELKKILMRIEGQMQTLQKELADSMVED